MRTSFVLPALALAAMAGTAHAAFTPGNVVVYRVGDGAAGLVNTGAKVFVDEYTPTGTLVQSVEMPSTGSTAKLIASGTATSEGLLTVSPNGQWVTLTGYSAVVPTTSLANTTGTAVNRTVAVINAATGATTYTLLSDFASGNNPRSAVTTNGTDLWVTGGAGGVRYTTTGSTTSTQLTTLANYRQVNIFDGQLYATTNSGSGGNTVSIGAIGAGLPTTTGQTYSTLPGLSGVTGTSRYAFLLLDLSSAVAGPDTLYIADDGAAALTKYSLVGGSWTSNGTVGVDADDYRGITGYADPSGAAQLFATRKGGSAAAGGGELVSIADFSGYNGAFTAAPTLLATAGTNTSFRGVAYIVPTPGAGALLAVGGLAAVRRRRV